MTNDADLIRALEQSDLDLCADAAVALRTAVRYGDAAMEMLAVERAKNERLVGMIASLYTAMEPPDVPLDDGRVMRFVPPDPELYWRHLSRAVKAAMNADLHSLTASASLTRNGNAEGQQRR